VESRRRVARHRRRIGSGVGRRIEIDDDRRVDGVRCIDRERCVYRDGRVSSDRGVLERRAGESQPTTAIRQTVASLTPR
jgi:hypothetical protein